MAAAVSSRDVLKPRGPDRIGRGLMLALIVHVGLIIAIAIGVNWRSRAPEAMSAELWSAVPQAAAPRAVEPDPTPPTPPTPPKPVPVPKPTPVPKVEPPPVRETPDAQIAIEKAKREKERKKQLEEEEAQREREQQRKKDQAAAAKQQELDRKKKAEDDKREAERKKAEALQLAKQRDENLKRMMGQAGANGEPGSTGAAKRSSGPSANYAGRVQARVMPNVVFTDETQGNPVAEIEVRTAPDGTIVGTPRLTKSSGVPSWDDAALRAVIKTGILPRDVDGTVPSPLIIVLKPRF